MIHNNRPVLVNDSDQRTIHEFVGSEIVTLDDASGRKINGIAHMFRCTVTGAVRRFGFDACSSAGERAPSCVG